MFVTEKPNTEKQILTPIIRYPAPPINFLLEDELAWMDLDEITMQVHNFEYSYKVEDNWREYLELGSNFETEVSNDKIEHDPLWHLNNESKEKLKKLLKMASQEELSCEMLDELKNLLSVQTKTIPLVEFDIFPDTLTNFIDNNSSTAVDFLVHLGQTKYPQTKDYLKILTQKQSNHTKHLEIVNNLTIHMDLPSVFIHQLIANLIQDCEDRTKDKVVQKRLVRMLCTFIRSLLSSKILKQEDGAEIFIEIKTFVTNFCHIKECQALYTILKSISPNSGIRPSNL